MRFTNGLRWKAVKVGGEVPVFLLKAGFFILTTMRTEPLHKIRANPRIFLLLSFCIHLFLISITAFLPTDLRGTRSSFHNIQITFLPQPLPVMAQEKKTQIKKTEELPSALLAQSEVKVTEIIDPLSHPSQIDKEKPINPSTLLFESQGLLRVDPEQHFFIPPSQEGFSAAERVNDLPVTETSLTSPSHTEVTLKRDENQFTLREPFTTNENPSISFSHFHPKESYGDLFPQTSSSETPRIAMKNSSPSNKEILVVQPRYADNPKPDYPNEARKKGYQGEVVLRAEVLSNGLVGKIEVKNSSGYEILDHSALTAVKQWKFAPAKKGENTVPLWVNIPIKFQLQ